MNTKIALSRLSRSLALLPLALTPLSLAQAQDTTPQAVAKPTLTVLHSFTREDGTGTSTQPPLTVGADGALYGVAESGGDADYGGTIYKVTQGGIFHKLAALYRQNGVYPEGPLLLLPGGALMGTAVQGGSSDTGALFLLTPPHRFQTKHEFSAVNSAGGNTRGVSPAGALVLGEEGAVYGTTIAGGSGGKGVVYRWTAAHGVEVVHDFLDGAQGALPERGLTLGPDGVLYGSTVYGGTHGYGNGTVYRLTIGGTFTMLHQFKLYDGKGPEHSPVFGTDGALYGATSAGGEYNNGLFYRITTNGSFKVVRPFSRFETNAGVSGLTLGPDGNFYGTESGLGAFQGGYVFRLTPDGSLTVLYSFKPDSAEGFVPEGGVTFEPDGALYGVTVAGGASGYGTIYKLRLPH